LRHQLLIRVEIGEDDDLADLGVLVTGRAGRAEAAPPAAAARQPPAARQFDGASLVLITQPTLSFSSATCHHRPFLWPVG
jgi:hypothetical protein